MSRLDVKKINAIDTLLKMAGKIDYQITVGNLLVLSWLYDHSESTTREICEGIDYNRNTAIRAVRRLGSKGIQHHKGMRAIKTRIGTLPGNGANVSFHTLTKPLDKVMGNLLGAAKKDRSKWVSALRKVVDKAFGGGYRMTISNLRILIYLYDHPWAGGSAIANDLGMAPTAVRRAVSRLQPMGIQGLDGLGFIRVKVCRRSTPGVNSTAYNAYALTRQSRDLINKLFGA